MTPLELLLVAFLFLLRSASASAVVQFRGTAFSFSFYDAPARFAVPVDGLGICGSLHLADPVYACSPIKSVNETVGSNIRFVLIERGTCSFEKKVRTAQEAGFDAVIVYDDQENGGLISMIGNPVGIKVHAVFVSKMAGESLKKCSQGEKGECCINPSTDETAGTVLVISLISLVTIVSVLATFFFARNCRRLRHTALSRPQTMNKQEVDVLPSFKFKVVNPNKKCESETCAICLEDYRDGETLRILPCQHEFHSVCIDSWLTKWGTFCPVCKHDMNSGR